MSQTYGPYTPVRRAGNFYYISGQVGINPVTNTASSDVGEQARQVLSNMQAVITEHSLTMDHIIKTTIFLTDIGDFAAVNSVYETFFNTPRPARSTIQIAALPKLAGDTALVVEIEAVAYKESD